MSNTRLMGAVFCAALLLFTYGCDKKPAAGKPAAEKSPVLVVVNNADITLDDYREEAAALSPAAQSVLVEPEARNKFLDNLVAKRLLVQQALKAGLDKDPEVVKRLNQTRDNLVLGLYVKNEVFDKANFTDADVKKYFDEHKDSLGSVRISHVQVPSKEIAQEVLAKYKAGEKFQDLVARYSQDSGTKGRGGDLGYLSWAQFGSGDLREAAFGTKVGEVGNVVRSSFAYHVIKVTDKKPAKDEEYDMLKDKIKEYLVEKRKEELFDSIVKGLKDKATITPGAEVDKHLASLVRQPEQQGMPAEGGAHAAPEAGPR